MTAQETFETRLLGILDVLAGQTHAPTAEVLKLARIRIKRELGHLFAASVGRSEGFRGVIQRKNGKKEKKLIDTVAPKTA